MVVSVIMFNVHNWKGVYMSSGMFGYVDVLKTAADASWAREEVLTNNIANVDTPNYYLFKVCIEPFRRRFNISY